MQIIIPMAGRGDRYARDGFKAIKPLIQIDGRPMIEHIIGLFPRNSDFLFICAEDHLEKTPLAKELKRIAPTGQIASIAPHKLGPVHTVLAAADKIRNDAPVLLSYCDYSVYWNYDRFLEFLETTNCDGCILSYKGFHPHTLGPNLYAYLRTEGDKVREIREKGCFTDNRMQEHASAGMYHFKKGSLLKECFSEAVEKDLKVQGEFYASVPYNLLIEKKLDVRAFEVEHFLQWGTPEDLREYQAWSNYFARPPAQANQTPRRPWTLLLPMAGEGKRFVDAGYLTPKPLIPVEGFPMIRRAIGGLPPCEKTLAVCQATVALGVQREMEKEGTKAVVKTVPALTEGAVQTCLVAKDDLDPARPLVIAACDMWLGYDKGALATLTSRPNLDFVIFTFRNHPHANRNPKQYAWVETSGVDTVKGVSCKKPLSEDVRKDPGVTGAFWFRRPADFIAAAEEVIAGNQRVNNEFYVDTVLDRMAKKGLHGVTLDVSHFVCFGTPDDLRTYEYWASYFRKLALQPRPVRERA